MPPLFQPIPPKNRNNKYPALAMADNLIVSVLIAPVVMLLSTMSLVMFKRGLMWVEAVAKANARDLDIFSKTLKPVIKNVYHVLKVQLDLGDSNPFSTYMKVSPQLIVLATIVVLLIVVVIELSNFGKKITKAIKVNEEAAVQSAKKMQ